MRLFSGEHMYSYSAQRPPELGNGVQEINKEKEGMNVGIEGERDIMGHWHPSLCGVPTKWQIISRLDLVRLQSDGLSRACKLKRPHQLVSCLLAVNIKCLRIA